MLNKLVKELLSLKRFFSAFHFTTFLAVLLYLYLRKQVNWREPIPFRHLIDGGHLWYWEKRAGWTLLPLAAVKLMRRSTLDGYISEMSWYTRAICVTMLIVSDYRLGVFLALGTLLSFLLFPQPKFRGTNTVNMLTPASLDRLALGEHSKELWLVMFTAPWAAPSLHAGPTFADLSLVYKSEHVKFGEIDVSRWPKLAQKFGIDIEGIPHQLPTFILFQEGKVVKKVPEGQEPLEKNTRLRNLLVRDFELDMLLAKGLH